MIVIGVLVLLVLLGAYCVLWSALAFTLALMLKRRRLALLEADGSFGVFILRLVLIAMPLFPCLYLLFSMPFQFVDSVNLLGWKAYSDVTSTRRLIEDGRVSALTAAALALFIGSTLVLLLQRRRQPTQA